MPKTGRPKKTQPTLAQLKRDNRELKKQLEEIKETANKNFEYAKQTNKEAEDFQKQLIDTNQRFHKAIEVVGNVLDQQELSQKLARLAIQGVLSQESPKQETEED